MRVAIIGRTEMLFEGMRRIAAARHEIVLVATAKASPEAKAGPDEFAAAAESLGAPFLFVHRFKAEHVAAMMACGADIAVTMNWPTIMDRSVVDCFQHGVINAHGSDLPKYRGNACPNWAILQGEQRIGLTFHEIDPDGLDTGRVLMRKFLTNGPDLYIQDVYDWLAEAVPSGFVEVLEGIAAGEIKSTAQDHRQATRAYPRRPEDGQLRFDLPAEHLHRLVRASSAPFPGAFCFYEGAQKVVVWRASVVTSAVAVHAIPGQIMHFDNGAPVVACGDGQGLRFDHYTIDSGQTLGPSVRARMT